VNPFNFRLKKPPKKLPKTLEKKQKKQKANVTPSGRSKGEFSIVFPDAFLEN
jgi:hypothetical protein